MFFCGLLASPIRFGFVFFVALCSPIPPLRVRIPQVSHILNHKCFWLKSVRVGFSSVWIRFGSGSVRIQFGFGSQRIRFGFGSVRIRFGFGSARIPFGSDSGRAWSGRSRARPGRAGLGMAGAGPGRAGLRSGRAGQGPGREALQKIVRRSPAGF